jgi:hypothetical protein
MQIIYTLFTVIIILLNMAGMSILFSKIVPYYTLARAAGLVLITSFFFFVEHFFGLGSLNWVWPITSAASAYLIYRKQNTLKTDGFIGSEIVFYLGFFYCFIWRFTFPDLPAGHSEHLTDLYFILNYMQGTQLPPTDLWHPPYQFDFYYAFMHYGAALLGRTFALDGGYAYHMAFCILVASTVSLGWFFTAMFSKRIWTRVLLISFLVFGGTGVAPLTHFIMDEDPNNDRDYGGITNKFLSKYHQLDNEGNRRKDANGDYIYTLDYGKTWTKLTSSVRFVGNFETHINTDFGRQLFPKLTPEEITEKTKRLNEQKCSGCKTETFTKRALPAEIFSYQLYLGDYHPPVGGYFLLLLILACIGLLERQPNNKLAQAMITFTMPLILITNSWVFPLQVLLTGGWIAYRYFARKPPSWFAMLAGGFAALAMIYPFMEGFGTKTLDTPILAVTGVNHTPLNVFVAVFWPLMLLAILSVVDFFWSKGLSEKMEDGLHKRHLVLALGITSFILLMFTEFVYVDDPTAAQYLRTNTTMKWWGWLWVAAMMSMAGALISSPKKVVRWITVATLLILTVPYAFELIRVYVATPADHMGKLQGSMQIEKDTSKRDLLNYLKDADKGIVLESNLTKNNDKGAYTDTTVIPLFAQQPSAYGWKSHLHTWNGYSRHLEYMYNDIVDVYANKHADALGFLLHHDVKYMVWTGTDTFRHDDPSIPNNGASRAVWNGINDAIKAKYHWRSFYNEGKNGRFNEVGIWVRKD